MLRDFLELLGIRSVAQLARQNPEAVRGSWGAWQGSIRTSACWMCFARRWRRRGIPGCWVRKSASGGGGAKEGSNEAMK
jgi:hypothetical protein